MPTVREPVVVYIVDDDEAVRTGMSRLMRSAGFVVRAFECPNRFLDEVREERSACLLLDMTLPRVTGVQVQSRLQERGIRLPVIVVSARDDEETRRTARALGAQFFFRKPVDDQALLDAIAWVTGSRESARPG